MAPAIEEMNITGDELNENRRKEFKLSPDLSTGVTTQVNSWFKESVTDQMSDMSLRNSIEQNINQLLRRPHDFNPVRNILKLLKDSPDQSHLRVFIQKVFFENEKIKEATYPFLVCEVFGLDKDLLNMN